MLGRVVLDPVHNLEALRPVQGNRVTLKQVGQQDEIAVGGKLISNELCVDKLVTDDIGKDEDGILCGLVRWVGEVG